MELFTALLIGLLFSIGIFQMLRRNVIRSVIGLMILANAVNLFLLSMGAYTAVEPAYVNGSGATRSDALPQALILTALVISMGGTAFLLSLLYIISSRYRTSDMDQVSTLKQ